MVKLKMFAAKLYREITSSDDVAVVQWDLDVISEWSSDWQIIFNSDNAK